MAQEKIHSDKNKARFDSEKAKMRSEVISYLDELNAELQKQEKTKGKQINKDKLLELFDNPAGEEQEEVLVLRGNGDKVLKDKSGKSREKIKIDGRKFLKVKDRNNKEILKIDLEKDEIKRMTGEWLEDLEKEVTKESAEARDNDTEFQQGSLAEYSLAGDVKGKAIEYKKPTPADIIAGFNKKTGRISFNPNAKVGLHNLSWSAKGEDGKWTTAILMVEVTKKPNEVDPKLDEKIEKYKTSLVTLDNSIKDIEVPVLGVGQYNLDRVAAQIKIAEEYYQESENAANVAGITDRTELIRLRNNLDDKIADLEQAEAKRTAEQGKIEEKMDEFVKKAVDKQKRDEADDKRILDKMKSEMAETEANLAKTAAESFDKIKNGSFVGEIKETGFNPKDLESIEGVQFGLQKHSLAVQNYEKEVQIMGKGMEAMQAKQIEFEDKKSDLFSMSGLKNIGKVAGIGAAGGVAALLGGASVAFLPATMAVAATLGVATIAKNLAGAVYRRFGTPSPDSWLAHGSILGAITGENDEAYALQKEKQEFETKYVECSEKLKEKGNTLKDEGNQLQTVNGQGLIDNQVLNGVPEDFRENLENLYKEVGLDPKKTEYSEKIDQKILDVQAAIETQNSAKLSELTTIQTASIAEDQKVFAGDVDPIAYLEQSKEELSGMEFAAADIFDSTLGVVGKTLQKAKVVPLVGGVFNAVGKLTEGVGGILSRPDRFGNALLGIIGLDLSENNVSWTWKNAGHFYGGLVKGMVASESWSEAGEKEGWEAANAYVNAGMEVLTNIAIILFTFGAGAEVEGGSVLARTLSRMGKGAGRIKRGIKAPFTRTGWRKAREFAKKTTGKVKKFAGSKFKKGVGAETTKGGVFTKLKNWWDNRNKGGENPAKKTLENKSKFGRLAGKIDNNWYLKYPAKGIGGIVDGVSVVYRWPIKIIKYLPEKIFGESKILKGLTSRPTKYANPRTWKSLTQKGWLRKYFEKNYAKRLDKIRLKKLELKERNLNNFEKAKLEQDILELETKNKKWENYNPERGIKAEAEEIAKKSAEKPKIKTESLQNKYLEEIKSLEDELTHYEALKDKYRGKNTKEFLDAKSKIDEIKKQIIEKKKFTEAPKSEILN